MSFPVSSNSKQFVFKASHATYLLLKVIGEKQFWETLWVLGRRDRIDSSDPQPARRCEATIGKKTLFKLKLFLCCGVRHLQNLNCRSFTPISSLIWALSSLHPFVFCPGHVPCLGATALFLGHEGCARELEKLAVLLTRLGMWKMHKRKGECFTAKNPISWSWLNTVAIFRGLKLKHLAACRLPCVTHVRAKPRARERSRSNHMDPTGHVCTSWA